MLINYISSDVKKKPSSYIIGIFTVIVTITFIVFLYSIVDILPLVFLKQAQNTAGESDFVYKAKNSNKLSSSIDTYIYNSEKDHKRQEIKDNFAVFINYTKIDQQTQNFSKFNGVTPRWFGVADFISPQNPTTTINNSCA